MEWIKERVEILEDTVKCLKLTTLIEIMMTAATMMLMKSNMLTMMRVINIEVTMGMNKLLEGRVRRKGIRSNLSSRKISLKVGDSSVMGANINQSTILSITINNNWSQHIITSRIITKTPILIRPKLDTILNTNSSMVIIITMSTISRNMTNIPFIKIWINQVDISLKEWASIVKRIELAGLKEKIEGINPKSWVVTQ